MNHDMTRDFVECDAERDRLRIQLHNAQEWIDHLSAENEGLVGALRDLLAWAEAAEQQRPRNVASAALAKHAG